MARKIEVLKNLLQMFEIRDDDDDDNGREGLSMYFYKEFTKPYSFIYLKVWL